jgi:hypothetical protein
VLGGVLASLFLFSDAIPVGFASARYQFRDPLILCVVLLAGLAATRLGASTRTRALTTALLGAQVAVITYTAWPYLARTWGPEGRRAAAFLGATGETPLVDRLIADMRAPGRLLYSPRVDHAVVERGLVDDGIGINGLAYRNVSVANGLFKGVATDPWWPNDRLFYGWLRTPAPLFASGAALDVLGIRYVLALADEPVAPGLVRRGSYTTIRGAELLLFENTDAWEGAFLIDPAKLPAALPRLAECPHDRLLCRDLGALAEYRDRVDVTVERGGNAIDVRWTAGSEPRVLILSEMYRAEWTVTAGDVELQPRAFYSGLLGVALPPQVSSARFTYRPRGLMAATTVSVATIVAALAALAAIVPRRTAPPSATVGISRPL